MEPAVSVVGLGGSLRKGSTSLAALEVTLEAAAKAGASTRLFAVGELDLPMYRPGMDAPPAAQSLLEQQQGRRGWCGAARCTTAR
jgi:FMN reductase